MGSISERLGAALQVVGQGIYQVGLENHRARLQAQRDKTLNEYGAEEKRLDREQTSAMEEARRKLEERRIGVADRQVGVAEGQLEVARRQLTIAEQAKAAQIKAEEERLRLAGLEQADRSKLTGAQIKAIEVGNATKAAEYSQMSNMLNLVSKYQQATDPKEREKLAEDILATGGKPNVTGIGGINMTDEERNVRAIAAAKGVSMADAWDEVLRAKRGKNEVMDLAQALVDSGEYPTVGAAIVDLQNLGGGSKLSSQELTLVGKMVAAGSAAQVDANITPNKPGYQSPAEMAQEAAALVRDLRDTAAGSGLKGITFDENGMAIIRSPEEQKRLAPGTRFRIADDADGEWAEYRGRTGTMN